MTAKQQDTFTKKRAERRRRIRRRRAIITLITLIIIAAVTGIVLSLTVLFPITSVKANGSKIYTSSEIIKASGLDDEDNIFTFSKSRTIKSIQKQLPFAEKIEIKRKLPDTVVITVQDAVEFACYPVDGEYFTVSRAGRVLSVYEQCPEGIFVIRTSGAVCELGEEIQFKDEKEQNTVNAFVDTMMRLGMTINEIDVTNPLSLYAKVNGRFTVDFGTNGSLEKKIEHLGGMLHSIADTRTGHINLSMWTSEKTEGTFTEKVVE